jgi:hypothetical protein
MVLVREVSGPAHAKVGEKVTYRVTQFNQPDVSPAEAAAVHWLVKSSDGASLLSERNVGRDLAVVVPASWAGQTVLAMPFVRSPSAQIAVETAVAATPTPVVEGERRVDVVREGSRYYASLSGQPRFYVGTDVRYGSRRGLMNTSNPPGPRYRAEDYEGTHGDWAWYLLPTITAESNRFFTCLNTYDRARFTFGHIQLAAHTPGENFVLILREMLALPLAASYFPDLTVRDGRVHLRAGGSLRPLESDSSTADLQAYWNPSDDQVDDVEAERAARIVDWCTTDPGLRELNVDFAIRQQRRKLRSCATKLPLDGVVDKLCIVVLDILHQGRARFASIKHALAADDPFDTCSAWAHPRITSGSPPCVPASAASRSEPRWVARSTTAPRRTSSCRRAPESARPSLHVASVAGGPARV